jgi:hypothetical protein
MTIDKEKLLKEGAYAVHHYTFSWAYKPLWKRILRKFKTMIKSI